MAGQSEETYFAGPWRIVVKKSHILHSKCERSLEDGCARNSMDRCSVCMYEQELDLPLPEMVFPESMLLLEHCSGAILQFAALDALKLVNNTQDLLKVAAAEEWGKQRRDGLQKVKDVTRPFDWTYTTNYKGTLSGSNDATFQVCDTSEKINYEKLKEQEKIAFYDEVILFEDELADNGAAILSVKVRVMESGFFLLLRFFLRVDGVLVRLNDTRFYHQAGNDFFLREYSRKEAKVSELQVHPSVLTDPNELNTLLPVQEQITHKLLIPNT